MPSGAGDQAAGAAVETGAATARACATHSAKLSAVTRSDDDDDDDATTLLPTRDKAESEGLPPRATLVDDLLSSRGSKGGDAAAGTHSEVATEGEIPSQESSHGLGGDRERTDGNTASGASGSSAVAEQGRVTGSAGCADAASSLEAPCLVNGPAATGSTSGEHGRDGNTGGGVAVHRNPGSWPPPVSPAAGAAPASRRGFSTAIVGAAGGAIGADVESRASGPGVDALTSVRLTQVYLQIIGPAPADEKVQPANAVMLTGPSVLPVPLLIKTKSPGEYTIYLTSAPQWLGKSVRDFAGLIPIEALRFRVPHSLFPRTEDGQATTPQCNKCGQPLVFRRKVNTAPLESGPAPIELRLMCDLDRDLGIVVDVVVHAHIPTTLESCRPCDLSTRHTIVPVAPRTWSLAEALAFGAPKPKAAASSTVEGPKPPASTAAGKGSSPSYTGPPPGASSPTAPSSLALPDEHATVSSVVVKVTPPPASSPLGAVDSSSRPVSAAVSQEMTPTAAANVDGKSSTRKAVGADTAAVTPVTTRVASLTSFWGKMATNTAERSSEPSLALATPTAASVGALEAERTVAGVSIRTDATGGAGPRVDCLPDDSSVATVTGRVETSSPSSGGDGGSTLAAEDPAGVSDKPGLVSAPCVANPRGPVRQSLCPNCGGGSGFSDQSEARSVGNSAEISGLSGPCNACLLKPGYGRRGGCERVASDISVALEVSGERGDGEQAQGETGTGNDVTAKAAPKQTASTPTLKMEETASTTEANEPSPASDNAATLAQATTSGSLPAASALPREMSKTNLGATSTTVTNEAVGLGNSNSHEPASLAANVVRQSTPPCTVPVQGMSPPRQPVLKRKAATCALPGHHKGLEGFNSRAPGAELGRKEGWRGGGAASMERAQAHQGSPSSLAAEETKASAETGGVGGLDGEGASVNLEDRAVAQIVAKVSGMVVEDAVLNRGATPPDQSDSRSQAGAPPRLSPEQLLVENDGISSAGAVCNRKESVLSFTVPMAQIAEPLQGGPSPRDKGVGSKAETASVVPVPLRPTADAMTVPATSQGGSVSRPLAPSGAASPGAIRAGADGFVLAPQGRVGETPDGMRPTEGDALSSTVSQGATATPVGGGSPPSIEGGVAYARDDGSLRPMAWLDAQIPASAAPGSVVTTSAAEGVPAEASTQEPLPTAGAAVSHAATVSHAAAVSKGLGPVCGNMSQGRVPVWLQDSAQQHRVRRTSQQSASRGAQGETANLQGGVNVYSGGVGATGLQDVAVPYGSTMAPRRPGAGLVGGELPFTPSWAPQIRTGHGIHPAVGAGSVGGGMVSEGLTSSHVGSMSTAAYASLVANANRRSDSAVATPSTCGTSPPVGFHSWWGSGFSTRGYECSVSGGERLGGAGRAGGGRIAAHFSQTSGRASSLFAEYTTAAPAPGMYRSLSAGGPPTLTNDAQYACLSGTNIPRLREGSLPSLAHTLDERPRLGGRSRSSDFAQDRNCSTYGHASAASGSIHAANGAARPSFTLTAHPSSFAPAHPSVSRPFIGGTVETNQGPPWVGKGCPPMATGIRHVATAAATAAENVMGNALPELSLDPASDNAFSRLAQSCADQPNAVRSHHSMERNVLPSRNRSDFCGVSAGHAGNLRELLERVDIPIATASTELSRTTETISGTFPRMVRGRLPETAHGLARTHPRAWGTDESTLGPASGTVPGTGLVTGQTASGRESRPPPVFTGPDRHAATQLPDVRESGDHCVAPEGGFLSGRSGKLRWTEERTGIGGVEKEGLQSLTAGMEGTSAGEWGHGDETENVRMWTILSQGLMNAMFLQLQFRCSEGTARRADDELSRLYITEGDSIIPDNSKFTGPSPGGKPPPDALFPSDYQERSEPVSLESRQARSAGDEQDTQSRKRRCFEPGERGHG